MSRWTEQGDRLISEVANRYGVSTEAVSLMLDSILQGNGTMAQFNIYELGGGGQWMRGGMTMVGDMFNYQLKSKVDGICNDLSSAVFDQGMQVVPQRSAGEKGGQMQGGWNQWWPSELGSPSTSGSQNQYRYAYFANAKRLAISDGQNTTIYNTLDHNIGGVSQQQGGVSGVTFTSQYGTVDLRTLPLVSGPALGNQGQSQAQPQSDHSSRSDNSGENRQTQHASAEAKASSPAANRSSGSSDDVFGAIERLAKLRDAGALTDDEFTSKKTELLSRL